MTPYKRLDERKKKTGQKVLPETSRDPEGMISTFKATSHNRGERIKAKNWEGKTRRKES